MIGIRSQRVKIAFFGCVSELITGEGSLVFLVLCVIVLYEYCIDTGIMGCEILEYRLSMVSSLLS